MSTQGERLRMADAIIDFEARRDRAGHLAIYQLRADDGGGTYEVAGINDRYHPQDAEELAALINSQQYGAAEARAQEIIVSYTDVVTAWTSVTAIESYLRDSAFNRGPRGAARILQRALAIKDDGVVGPVTLARVRDGETEPRALLDAMRRAREEYERQVVGRDERSDYWKGLVNRWNKALDFALTFLTADAPVAAPPSAPPPEPIFDSAGAAIAAATGAAPPVVAATAAEMDTSEARLAATVVTIKALRLGSQGPMVRAWQSFLLGQGFDPGGLDSDFGDKTVAATAAFQSRCGLTADGVAGRQTIIKAMEEGFEVFEEPAVDTSGSNFPPHPNFPPITTLAARQALFGAYSYVADPQPGNREHIRILGTWVRDNIITVPIPQLRTALGSGAPSGIQFHRNAAEQLRRLWEDWEKAGLLNRVLSYDGSFVPRFVRGSTVNLSNHAFGSAFDMNVAWNPLGARPALVGQKGSVRELVALANSWGFYWGGHYSTRLDGMHFEIAFLKS